MFEQLKSVVDGEAPRIPDDLPLSPEFTDYIHKWWVALAWSQGLMSLLERCRHFRGWYVQTSMELGPEDVSLLERCPHFRGWYICTDINGVGT